MVQYETKVVQMVERAPELHSSIDHTTRDWLAPRVDELRQRYGITRPDLISIVIGIPEEKIVAFLSESERCRAENPEEERK